MKIYLAILISLISLELIAQKHNMQKTIHDFTVLDIEGKDYPLAQLKGKKVMIVNTASKCGLTPQYEELQSLYESFKEDGLVIIGFPANNFMGQEPGDEKEIAAFCQANYGVTFPMMSKIEVIGDEQHELYKYLTSKSLNGVEDSEVQWNFQKYLIDASGKIAKVIGPKTSPKDSEIIGWLKS